MGEEQEQSVKTSEDVKADKNNTAPIMPEVSKDIDTENQDKLKDVNDELQVAVKWDYNDYVLLVQWYQKAKCCHHMHILSSRYHRKKALHLKLWTFLAACISMLISALKLTVTTVVLFFDVVDIHHVTIFVDLLNELSAFLTAILVGVYVKMDHDKKFEAHEKSAADFGIYVRDLEKELRLKRRPAKELIDLFDAEYDRLNIMAPSIPKVVIKLYMKKYGSELYIPDFVMIKPSDHRYKKNCMNVEEIIRDTHFRIKKGNIELPQETEIDKMLLEALGKIDRNLDDIDGPSGPSGPKELDSLDNLDEVNGFEDVDNLKELDKKPKFVRHQSIRQRRIDGIDEPQPVATGEIELNIVPSIGIKPKLNLKAENKKRKKQEPNMIDYED